MLWDSTAFSGPIGITDSNQTEVYAIREALRIFYRSVRVKLIVESDSGNAIECIIYKTWISLQATSTMFEIKHLPFFFFFLK